METQSTTIRKAMACGFLPPEPGAQAWRGGHHTAPEATTCVGYLIRLPVVQECARARVHWDKGQLDAFAKEPTELLVMGIEIIEGENAAVMRSKEKA